MPKEKRAKKSVAEVFLTDPNVLEQSRRMPKGLKRLGDMAFFANKIKRRFLGCEARDQHAQA